MRRLRMVLLATVAVVGVTTAQAEDAKPDSESIQGTWKIVGMESDGNPVPEEGFKQVQFVFVGEKFRIIDKSGEHETIEAAFKLDPTKNPTTLDPTFLNSPLKGKKVPCIYELKGDDLKLAWPEPGKEDRPTEFKTAPGSDVALYVLKRAK